MQKLPTADTATAIIELSELLAQYGSIKRLTKLPGGEFESDSHHALVVALTAYELAAEFAPELNGEKILLYGLVHDLPEVITGDVPTLLASPEVLAEKAKNDAAALQEILQLLKPYPHLAQALKAYEKGTDEESRFVYWIDKMITVPTHFHDKGEHLRTMGIVKRQDIADWYTRLSARLAKRGTTHPAASTILELIFHKLQDELLTD